MAKKLRSDEDKALLNKMFQSMFTIYPKIKQKIEHLQHLVINNYDKNEIEKLKQNVIEALEIFKNADKREIPVAKRKHLDTIVRITLDEILAIEDLEGDIEMFVKEPNSRLRKAIENLVAKLEELLAKEKKALKT